MPKSLPPSTEAVSYCLKAVHAHRSNIASVPAFPILITGSRCLLLLLLLPFVDEWFANRLRQHGSGHISLYDTFRFRSLSLLALL